MDEPKMKPIAVAYKRLNLVYVHGANWSLPFAVNVILNISGKYHSQLILCNRGLLSYMYL